MDFSIIVPIYNVEKYINRCVDSLINQTYSNIEIILVDDESPDNCSYICDEYKKKDERIKVIHKKNGGLSDARNAGLDVATGKYVIFVDSDDYVEENMCEIFANYIDDDIDIIVGDAVVEGGILDLSHVNQDHVMTGEEYLLCAYKHNKAPMAVWLNVYKREFLKKNNLIFKVGRLHEDEEFTPRAMLLAKTVKYVNNKHYHYIIRDNSITTKKDKRKNAADLYNTCCELKDIYEGLDNSELKVYLLDSLVTKYLSMFQTGRLYKYGKEYIHKAFVRENSILKKTRYKSMLYSISPRLYYYVNYISKLK